jgi:hypothetical protein
MPRSPAAALAAGLLKRRDADAWHSSPAAKAVAGPATQQTKDEIPMTNNRETISSSAEGPMSQSTAPNPTPSAVPYFWLWVLCLLGLDYFSTLAYQPSITFEVAGRLGPLATLTVVAATLFGALPVYCYMAGRSSLGRGSLGLIERFVRGWRGKTIVLILLGFTATDFTMLKTLSLADAAVHVLQSPLPAWQARLQTWTTELHDQATRYLDPSICERCNVQLMATLIIGLVSFFFWFILRKGFNRNVIVLAVPLVAAYLLMTGMLLYGGIKHLLDHPERIEMWLDQIVSGDWQTPSSFGSERGWWGAAAVSLLFLPKLALGLSGFELSMILIPQVKGRDLKRKIVNTRLVLVLAALTMAIYLPASSMVSTLLIPPDQFADNGGAVNRALTYLAHGQPLVEPGLTVLPWCGPWFGSAYDLVTVLLLSFAGTSVMTALAGLLPQFLLRFGMDFRWSHRWGVLLLVFAGINLAVTVHFRASVEAQRNAYATGVIVLIVATCLSSYADLRKDWRSQGGFFRGIGVVYFFIVAVGFVLVAIVVLWHAGGGLAIALGFIAAILALSVVSRAFRADELRTIGFRFKDDQSKFLWDALRLADFPILIPHRPGPGSRDAKAKAIREEHDIADDVDLVFLEVQLDDPSDFFQQVDVEVTREGAQAIIRLTGCASVAQAIAAVALEMSRYSKPPHMHFGWPELDLLSASWSYLAFGEGNIPWKVRELIHRAEPDASKRPRVVMG